MDPERASIHPVPASEPPVSEGLLEQERVAAGTGPAAADRPGDGRKRRLRLRLGAGALVVALGAMGWWLHARHYEDTDDAQVDGNISAVSPRVSGTVKAVRVVDNQRVKAGDVLVELDATDLEVALAEARAAVAQAEAQVSAENPNVPIALTSNLAAVESADADVQAARTELDGAAADVDQAVANDRLAQVELRRAKVLVSGDSIARSELDQRSAAAEVSRATVVAARKRLAGRRAKLDAALAHQREVRQNAPRTVGAREATVEVRRANLELARARLEEARLNLSYARIVAPADGIIGKKSVNVGDRVQPGQQLMALTQTAELWVTANFRETQIESMRIGQPASLRVDALSRDFEGEVESFAGATGSRYSLLPPENASGNYVKVVQRVPVRIRLRAGQPGLERLRPGMSVEPEVRVR
ncbi:HlyD family secretion protein [Anaeromyxobacter oryzae]|uniref:Secretion protein HlyD n=1 Tax=Anaeromyxobacter oryzae TaxID=2918170 RepID=A0ABM7WXI8_9BACT|nr:HlyD family secretion protein [Anaeromyxobacter oryzae]BDG04195.1 secretion protein HlyD [Anaeromyxobacter oryzae]